jgi:hypothetical protein
MKITTFKPGYIISMHVEIYQIAFAAQNSLVGIKVMLNNVEMHF